MPPKSKGSSALLLLPLPVKKGTSKPNDDGKGGRVLSSDCEEEVGVRCRGGGGGTTSGGGGRQSIPVRQFSVTL